MANYQFTSGYATIVNKEGVKMRQKELPIYLKKYLMTPDKQKTYGAHYGAADLFNWFEDKPATAFDRLMAKVYLRLKKTNIRLTNEEMLNIVKEVCPNQTHRPQYMLVKFLGNLNARRAIREARLQAATNATIDKSTIISYFTQLLSSAPCDVVAVHKYNCRHCHGYDHRYQWTESELVEAVEKARRLSESKGKPYEPPDGSGGLNFNPKGIPNPDCPQCGGDGAPKVIIKDTRTLTMGERLLVESISEDRYGAIKISFADRVKAAENIAKIIGIFDKVIAIQTEGVNLNPNLPVDANSTEQLLKAVEHELAKRTLH